VPPAVFARPASPEAGVEQHDGFMLRVTFGFGGGWISRSGSSFDYLPAEIDFSGWGLLMGFDIGAALIPNLVLHVRMSGGSIIDPNTTFDGEDQGTIEEFSGSAAFVGPAVSYYFMPINLYVTAAVGIGMLGFFHEEDEDARGGPDDGFGLNLEVGKEWWVGEQWGLGVAGRFWYAVGTDERGLDADFEGAGGGILVSATYQ
jgi:hypothetical protein